MKLQILSRGISLPAVPTRWGAVGRFRREVLNGKLQIVETILDVITDRGKDDVRALVRVSLTALRQRNAGLVEDVNKLHEQHAPLSVWWSPSFGKAPAFLELCEPSECDDAAHRSDPSYFLDVLAAKRFKCGDEILSLCGRQSSYGGRQAFHGTDEPRRGVRKVRGVRIDDTPQCPSFSIQVDQLPDPGQYRLCRSGAEEPFDVRLLKVCKGGTPADVRQDAWAWQRGRPAHARIRTTSPWGSVTKALHACISSRRRSNKSVRW